MFRYALAIFLALFAAPAMADYSGPTANVNGNIGGYNAVIANTPTVAASAYTANNAIGGLQTVAVFRTTAQPSGILATIGLASKSGLTTSEAIYAFSKSPASTCADKSAFVLSSTDLATLVPGFPVTLTPSATAGTTQTTAYSTLNIPVKNADTSVSTNLYFCAVTTGTPTPASTTDLVFTYTISQD